MGSIADLLGDQLRAGLAQLVDPDASDDAPGAAPASSESRVETAQDRAREAAMEAVLDEVELDPADACVATSTWTTSPSTPSSRASSARPRWLSRMLRSRNG